MKPFAVATPSLIVTDAPNNVTVNDCDVVSAPARSVAYALSAGTPAEFEAVRVSTNASPAWYSLLSKASATAVGRAAAATVAVVVIDPSVNVRTDDPAVAPAVISHDDAAVAVEAEHVPDAIDAAVAVVTTGVTPGTT